MKKKLRFRFGAPAEEVEKPAAAEQEKKAEATLKYWCRKFGDPELDEIVEDHRAWMESRGEFGRKADLASANFEKADLMGAELQGANLLRANLQGADLLLADLRGACLIEADLSDANLVSTNLRGASLVGANLSTATGLVARQLAGASLFGAALPESLYPFEGVVKAGTVSNVLQILLGVMTVVCIFLWAAVGATTDAQLVKNSPAPIPFAGNVMPTLVFYLMGPMLLAGVYIAFHFHLQRLWDALGELPAVFPDGRRLAECVPASMIALAPERLCESESRGTALAFVRRLFSKALAYWMVPATLILVWARYLTEQDWRGSLLQIFFILAAAAMSGFLPGNETSLFGSARGKRRRKSAAWDSWHTSRFMVITAVGCFLLVLMSLGVILGAPHAANRAPGLPTGNFRRWSANLFWLAGYDPFPNLSGARISDVPEEWFGAPNDLKPVKGAQLRNASLRYAEGDGAFFARAALQDSDLAGGNFSEADFRAANLTSANLKESDLSRANFQGADLTYAVLDGAIAVEAEFDGANLYSARLVGVRFDRGHLAKADLRGAVLETAELNQADFSGAYMGGAKLSGASLQSAHFSAAFLDGAELRNADLRGAAFAGAILSGADLSGSNLDGADLRGALSVTAAQICAAASRRGAQMDDALLQQVIISCGAGQ
ncbi:MAG: pentapeptide repeat-containing protein [Candidatus Acidiferrales bacterium]